MDHGDTAVEGGEGPGEGGRGVSLDQHRLWALVPQQRTQPIEDAYGDIRQGLAAGKDVQVMIGADVEQRMHLVKQSAVLGRYRNYRPEHRGPAERLDDGGHLDGLWPSSVDDHQLFHPCLLLWRPTVHGPMAPVAAVARSGSSVLWGADELVCNTAVGRLLGCKRDGGTLGNLGLIHEVDQVGTVQPGQGTGVVAAHRF